MATKIEHTSYTVKDGYVWRRRYEKSTLSISLKERDPNTATLRATLMDLKFLEYSAHSFSFSAMHESLKQYRDSIVKADEVNRLKNRLSGLGVNLADPSVPVPAVAQLDVVALHVAEAVKEANHKH